MQPYRTRKVRILNGAHTTMVPFSLLYGNETVKETVDNEFTGKFVRDAVFNEINPTLDLSEEEIRERMSGNICRCGAYNNIVQAVKEVQSGVEEQPKWRFASVDELKAAGDNQ